jgi:hypothetical protein
MRLTELFSHVVSSHLCGQTNKLYVVVKPDESQDTELHRFLEQNYPMAYSVISEADVGTIPPSAVFVSYLVFNGHRKFLENLYDVAAQDENHASSLLLSELEALTSRRNFGSVDTLLKTMDVTKLPYSTLLSAISFTWHSKSDLVCRSSFIKRVEVELTTKLGAERTSKLLQGKK